MSMTGKLKASTNRVRTSVAHNTHSIWTNAVGLEREGGNNAAVEGSLNAPQAGGGRASRRAAAAEVVEKTGGFDTSVEDYQALLSLARSQGAVGGQNRGACKICGQLGHLTKQCRNHLSANFKLPGTAGGAGAVADGKPLMPTLPVVQGNEEDLSSDLSDLDSSSSDSASSSESEDERRKRKDKERKRKHKEASKSKSKKHKHKKDKKSKHKKHSSKKRRKDDSSESD
ncbi:hypothetical protein WJX82_009357 [Trebouxia sp. C0006]